MTLAGISAALGLIADDAIVVVEDIEHRRAEGHEHPTREALRALLPALIGSSLSTTIILVPFALLPGVTGAFFKPLALAMVLLVGLLLVGLIVLFEFGDWRAPVVTVLSALGVLPGVLGLLLLTGMTLNVSSYVGAIMMVGIVGENAIFVLHEGRNLRRLGLTSTELWVRASRRRLRPVAMTVLATAFALAPLALALGEGAQLMRPLAIAVIGGFIISGPIVLFVLPGLYRLLDSRTPS